jgi:hypothetical protein
MSKKNKQKINKKEIIEFEIENSELPKFEESEGSKGQENVVMGGNAETDEVGKTDDEKVIEMEKAEDGTEDAIDGSVAKKRRSGKTDKYIEFILIFILGVLIGIACKTEAEKRITIGFNDYQMKIMKQDFDINKLQIDVDKKNMEAAEEEENAQAQDGEAPDAGQ